jgi:hypothetical protein
MFIDEIRSDFTQLQSDIADGPILPTVTITADLKQALDAATLATTKGDPDARFV